MSTINENSSGTPAGDPTQSRTLGEILADPYRGGRAVAVMVASSGHRAIVLGRIDDQQVRIASDPDWVIAAVAATTLAYPISDPADQLAIYGRTVAQLVIELDARDGRLRDLTERHDALERLVEQIREYAIDRYRDGDICHSGLSRFLSYFDMAPFAPQTRVRYTIVGSYLVNGDNLADEERYACGQLGVDFGDIDDFVGGRESPTITADATLE